MPRLASATPQLDRVRVLEMLRRALWQVGGGAEFPEVIAESYYDLLRSLEMTGTVDQEVLRRAQLVGRMLGRAYAVPEAEVLRATEYPAAAVAGRLESRARVIHEYNSIHA